MPVRPTLPQLRCIRQVVASKFSVSRAAQTLHSTQPNLSKVIKGLEDELGFAIFVREGNRLTGLTELGHEVYLIAGRMLEDAQALRQLRSSVDPMQKTGRLRIATTQIHARYRLLDIAERFLKKYPGVKLEYVVGTPDESLHRLREGLVDIAISTMPSPVPPDVQTIEAYTIDRCLVVPSGHPLLQKRTIRLKDLLAYPWIVHDERLTSGMVVQRTFQAHGLQPNIVMHAMDGTVIKAYVARGIGIAVLQTMAMEADNPRNLRTIDARHLFPSSTAMIAVRTGHNLKAFALDFIQMVVPELQLQELHARFVRGQPLFRSSHD